MKIGRKVSELWRVENLPLPLTWPMAYTTACTTVQAVITVVMTISISATLQMDKCSGPPTMSTARSPVERLLAGWWNGSAFAWPMEMLFLSILAQHLTLFDYRVYAPFVVSVTVCLWDHLF